MRSSDRGFTISEFLVVSFLGLLLMGSVTTSALGYKKVLGKDIVRSRLNQNLRGALDILAADVRVGGENLVSSFPAVELVNGAGGASDELIVRRNLLDEVLPVCVSINSGASVSSIYFAVSGNVAGCAYSGHASNYDAWRNYRIANGGSVRAYIFNTSTKQGEFFDYTGESDTGSQYYLSRPSGSFANSYPVGASAVYILEEWRYRVDAGLFQIVENRDTANPLNVAYDIADLQLSAVLSDGTTVESFGSSDDWTEIARISVSLTGTDRYNGETISRTASSSFFPRNILSN